MHLFPVASLCKGFKLQEARIKFRIPEEIKICKLFHEDDWMIAPSFKSQTFGSLFHECFLNGPIPASFCLF